MSNKRGFIASWAERIEGLNLSPGSECTLSHFKETVKFHPRHPAGHYYEPRINEIIQNLDRHVCLHTPKGYDTFKLIGFSGEWYDRDRIRGEFEFATQYPEFEFRVELKAIDDAEYRIIATVCRCLNGQAERTLSDEL